MAAHAGNLTLVGNPFDLSLFFARQPEPDLEFTEEELDQTTTTRPITPIKMPKKSGGRRPLLWIILLALVAGIGYIATEPEQLTEWLAPILGEPTPQQPPPPIAMQPKPSVPAPVAPAPAPAPEASTPNDGMTPPAPTAATPAQTAAPAPAAPAPQGQAPMTSAPTPAAPKPAAPPAPAMGAAAPARPSSSPLFGEGQKVTVMGASGAPGEMVTLTMDPAGTKPGPSIRPGVTLSVLDGDLQAGGWVYSVRTDDGVKGWIPEKRLRLKF